MPVAVALDAVGQRHAGAAEEAGRAGRRRVGRARSSSARRTARPRRCSSTAVVAGATLADGLQKALDEALAKLPIPKVMSYQLERRRRWTEREASCARPTAWSRCTAPTWCRSSALGLTSGRDDARPPLRGPGRPGGAAIDADTYAQQLREKAPSSPASRQRRTDIARQLQAAAKAERRR